MKNLPKLTREMQNAGLPVESVTEVDVYYTRELTGEEQGAESAVILAHDPTDFARQRLDAVKDDAGLTGAMKTITPAEAEAYVISNVTDLASAKTVISKMARLLIVLRNMVSPEMPEL